MFNALSVSVEGNEKEATLRKTVEQHFQNFACPQTAALFPNYTDTCHICALCFVSFRFSEAAIFDYFSLSLCLFNNSYSIV